MIRRSITCQGVCRSDSEIETWSCPSGAPSTAAAASAAVTPGTPITSIDVVGDLKRRAAHRVDARVAGADQGHRPPGPGLRHRLGGPLLLRAEVAREHLGARPQQIGGSAPGTASSPTTTAARRSSATARGVIRSRAPGPIPITASRPRGRARATATVACALARLAASSTDRPAAISAAASATLGVPTARRTTSLGFGTGTAASRLAGKVTTDQPRCAAAASKPCSSAFRSAVASWRTEALGDTPRSSERLVDELTDLRRGDALARAHPDTQRRRAVNDGPFGRCSDPRSVTTTLGRLVPGRSVRTTFGGRAAAASSARW